MPRTGTSGATEYNVPDNETSAHEFRARAFSFSGVPTHRNARAPDRTSHHEAHLFSQLDGSTRRTVRKAQADGIQVAIGTSWTDMLDFYRLHCRTRREHGLPPPSMAFFRNIQRYVVDSGQSVVVSARRGDTVIAAAVFFHFGDTAWFKFGASDSRQLQHRPNDAVMWAAICHYAAKGFGTLHLGRTNTHHAGLSRFKRGFGAREEPYAYYRYDLRSSLFTADSDRTSGWHTHVFRRTPIWFNRMCGSMLYRFMT